MLRITLIKVLNADVRLCPKTNCRTCISRQAIEEALKNPQVAFRIGVLGIVSQAIELIGEILFVSRNRGAI
ncbi:hypothetical protein D1920_20900 [Rhodopseudomonas palustris]|nr:hypothetical protein D1920_20900 [Rhodopseudomonas palustris]